MRFHWHHEVLGGQRSLSQHVMAVVWFSSPLTSAITLEQMATCALCPRVKEDK
jgi:hypothetical protein